MPSTMILAFSDLSYCCLCDRYFPGDEARAEHVQFSTNHPKCDACDKRFANGNSLRNHWVSSSRHHYCAVCEVEFETAAGLRVHVEFAAVHRDDSDDEDDEDDDDFGLEYEPGWEDIRGRELYPEENAAAERTASDDESDDGELEDYWFEDDEDDFEEEQEHYRGFALTFTPNRVPPSVYARPRAPSGDSNADSEASFASVSNRAIASDSEDEDEVDPRVPNNAPSAAAAAAAVSAWTERSKDAEAPEVVEDPAPPPTGVYFSCAMCLEAPLETSATRCGHVFCTPCITTALEARRRCPVCREVAGPRQLRRIFLSAN